MVSRRLSLFLVGADDGRAEAPLAQGNGVAGDGHDRQIAAAAGLGVLRRGGDHGAAQGDGGSNEAGETHLGWCSWEGYVSR
jgi:hypothetical protein